MPLAKVEDAAAAGGGGQDAALDAAARWAVVLSDVTELLATGRLPMDASVAQIRIRFGKQIPDVNRSFFTRKYGDLRDAGRAIVVRAQALQVASNTPSDADARRVMEDEAVQAILRHHKLNDMDPAFIKNALAVNWPRPRVTKISSAEHDADVMSVSRRVLLACGSRTRRLRPPCRRGGRPWSEWSSSKRASLRLRRASLLWMGALVRWGPA